MGRRATSLGRLDSTSTECNMMSYRSYKREADALTTEIEEKRDAVPEPAPVAAAVPEPEPTSYGSYADYGESPSSMEAF